MLQGRLDIASAPPRSRALTKLHSHGNHFQPQFLGSFWFFNSVERIIFLFRGLWGKLEGDERFVLLCGRAGGAVLKAPFVRPRRGPGALGGTGAWQIPKPTARPGRAGGCCPLLIPNPWLSSGHRGCCQPPAPGSILGAELGMRCWMQDGGFRDGMEDLGHGGWRI